MRTSPAETIARHRRQGWWSDTTIADVFHAAVARAGDRVAVVDAPNRPDLGLGAPVRWTYQELASRVDRLSAQLLGQGLNSGDIVLTQLPNVCEYVALYLAAAEIGLVLSPVAMQYRRHELETIATMLEPKAFVTCGEFKAFDHASLAADLARSFHSRAMVIGASAPAGAVALDADAGSRADRDAVDAYRRAHPVSADDIFTICWTSGTEGTPKGVPRSHNHWIAISWAHLEAAKIAPGDTLLNPFPMINMAAIGGCFMSWLHSAGTLLLHHPLDLKVYLQQIAVERPQYAIAPPALLNMLIRDERMLANLDITSLRCIGSGSAPLSPSMIAGFRERFGIEIVNIFGSNEGVSLVSGPDDIADPEQRAKFFPRFGRSEVVWPHRVSRSIQTRIVDPESDREILEPGLPGEMQVRGPTVFDGYFKAPEATARAFTADGYFRTGDLFEIAADGSGPRYYRFVGRCRQLIVRGGVKVSPEEIDELIATCPEVLEGAAVGYPDDVMGERICAVVVPRPGSEVTLERLQQHFAARGVAVFKWPERLRVVAQLPRNPVGKVVRGELTRVATVVAESSRQGGGSK